MPYQFLNVRREGPVEHLVLNRPDVRNAFNAEMIGELTAWAAAFARQSDARVVVLSGAGKAFCAGADAAWMAETVSYSEAENLRDAGTASAMFRALDELPVSLVGRIHGAAIGGGAGLAAVCDIAIADDDAVFGFTEVKLGIVPAVISPFVLAKIGRSAARELFLSGARFPAARAYKIGLVHAVVSPADLDDTVARYVAEIASAGREAIATAKALIRDVWGRTAADAAPITAAALAARRVSPEGQEGLRAFLEKRKPRWTS
jgi:methylglutaconyl-CoA hydratase